MRVCVISDLESIGRTGARGHAAGGAGSQPVAHPLASAGRGRPGDTAGPVDPRAVARSGTPLTALRQKRGYSRAPEVLAIGPAADSRLICSAAASRAQGYIDEADLVGGLTDSLSRLKTASPELAEPGRIISILAPNGGSGSSTLAVNVAAVLAKEHKTSVIFDLKLETGDLAALLDLKPTYTLADMCCNATRMDKVMFERCLSRHSSGVHLLAPPRTYSDIPFIKPEEVRQALVLARSLFPYVIVDHDHSYREEQLAVLRLADVVLLVLRLDFASLRNAQRTLAYLTDLGISTDKVHLVVNRFGQPQESARRQGRGSPACARFFILFPTSRENDQSGQQQRRAGGFLESPRPAYPAASCVTCSAVSINGRHTKH